MCQDTGYSSGLVYLAMLDCPIGHIPGRLPEIQLRRVSPSSEQYIRVNLSQLFIFGSYDWMDRVELEGFDSGMSQKQLVEVCSGTSYLDWSVQTIFIKYHYHSLLPPGFWLIISEPLSSDMAVLVARPADLWDPDTSGWALSLCHKAKTVTTRSTNTFARFKINSIVFTLILAYFIGMTQAEGAPIFVRRNNWLQQPNLRLSLEGRFTFLIFSPCPNF